MKNNIVGLKDLRENIESYVSEIRKGRSFVVVRKSKPVFKVVPVDEESGPWETVIDFTKIKPGGVLLSDILSRI